MDDTERPDPMLKQVPLIKNPSYQPPRPITLKTNYGKLIPTLSNTVIPPNINISQADIDKWLNELEDIKSRITKNVETEKFKEWTNLQKKTVAPGFDTFEGVMKPQHKPTVEPTTSTLDESHESNPNVNNNEKVEDQVNEIDKLFGKVL
ncbi:uncharacterized protein RJT21DRAFT_13048 [Scheffersomyces amazonensis]|uniref:uncharacterized protein n=1 Tax=Scheffersomyces amazonensis TaxID=1078765 RepID=UPI00315CB8B4